MHGMAGYTVACALRSRTVQLCTNQIDRCGARLCCLLNPTNSHSNFPSKVMSGSPASQVSHIATSSTASGHRTVIIDVLSPIAPRFSKETSRGVKRHLEFTHYRAEVTRKKARESSFKLNVTYGICFSPWFIHCHTDSPDSIDWRTVPTSRFIPVSPCQSTVAPRFLCLSKADLRTCIASYIPTKAGGVPHDTTQAQVAHVAHTLIDDYYKYVTITSSSLIST